MEVTYDENEKYLLGVVEERPTKIEGTGEVCKELSEHNRQRILATIRERIGEGIGYYIASCINACNGMIKPEQEIQKLKQQKSDLLKMCNWAVSMLRSSELSKEYDIDVTLKEIMWTIRQVEG